MSDFKIDSLGDLVFESGDFGMVAGLEEIAQRVRLKLELVQGEWFYDRTKGTPYYGRVFGKTKPDAVSMNAVFVQAILSVDGVEKLTKPIDYTFNKSNRILSFTFEAKTVEGTLIETVEVI